MLEELGFSQRDRNLIERNLIAGCENALVWLWVLIPRVADTLTTEATVIGMGCPSDTSADWRPRHRTTSEYRAPASGI